MLDDRYLSTREGHHFGFWALLGESEKVLRWPNRTFGTYSIHVASALACSPSLVSLSFPQLSVLSCLTIQRPGLYFLQRIRVLSFRFTNLMRTGATTVDSRPM